MAEKPRFSSRLILKINLIFAAIVLLSALVVALFSAQRIRRSTLDEVESNLAVRSLLLAEIATGEIAGNDPSRLRERLQERIRQLGRESATRMTVILADGRVAADSERNPATMDNHADRPEIKKAALYAHGVSIRFSHTLKTRMMYFARALRHRHRLIGYARCALPLTLIDRRIAASRKTILFGIAVVALLILVSAFFMSRWFIRPLATMTAMAEAMAAGDFSRRINLKRRDEIGRLAERFNQVAENSRRRIETIAFDRQKLDTILSGMSEGVVALDENEKIIHLNRAAAGLLEIDAGQALGRPLWEIVRLPELLELVRSSLRPETGTGSRKLRRTMTLRPGNPGEPGHHEKIIELHATPLGPGSGSGSSSGSGSNSDPDSGPGYGRPAGCVVVLLDITELRRLETVRRDFVANASHELKTPITAIRGLSETLLDDPAGIDDKTRTAFLEKIHTQALRLGAITTDLMALSRFEGETDLIANQPVELGGLAAEAAGSLKPAAEGRKIELNTELPDREIEVSGDGDALLQAVVNLLDNAVKYTPAGGRVTLRLRREANQAVIEVADTGIGIAPEDRERIFERFYRVDKARSRELGGTGLGLAIVRHIVLNHRGRIEVESRPGAGSCFRISLPLADDDIT